jgi:condensin complex subunit 2
LYRRFDIRFLKNKIWQSFENIENISKKKNEKIDFKTIVKNMSKDLTNETINNISTPTCFVCMLHLCNEKNLKINQNDDKTFFVDFDAKN